MNQPASFAVQLNGARGVIDAKVHTPAGVVEECYVSELDSGEGTWGHRGDTGTPDLWMWGCGHRAQDTGTCDVGTWGARGHEDTRHGDMMASPRPVHTGVLAWGVGTQGCGDTRHGHTGHRDKGTCLCPPGVHWGSAAQEQGRGAMGVWRPGDTGTRDTGAW